MRERLCGFILLFLLFSGFSFAKETFFQITLGGGDTNTWFTNDIDEDSSILELSAGPGVHFRKNLDLYLTADLHRFDIDGYGISYAFGITGRARFHYKMLFVETGIGPVVNNIPVKWFKYRFKWSPQVRVGAHLYRSSEVDYMLTYSLVHLSHSLISDRSNKGYDLNRIEFHVVVNLD